MKLNVYFFEGFQSQNVLILLLLSINFFYLLILQIQFKTTFEEYEYIPGWDIQKEPFADVFQKRCS